MSDVRGKTVRMDDDLWDAIEAERRRTGASEAELIRRAMTLYLAYAAIQREQPSVTLAAILESLGRPR